MQRSSPLADNLAAKAPHQIEIAKKAELLARVKVRRDGMLLNRGKVEGKQDREYRWVNVNSDRQIWFQSLGWELCTDPDIKCTVRPQADGTYIRGDLILYETSKEYADALHEYDVARGIEYLDGSKADFETAALKEGVTTVFEPKLS